MKLFVLAYPLFKSTDHNKIEQFRQQYDMQYEIVKPHFTIVFAIETFTQKEFIEEIIENSNAFKKINVSIKEATIHRDSTVNHFSVFLQAIEGNNQLKKLHDQLYSKKLSANLRNDIEYIPHITIGNFKNAIECELIVKEWNKTESAMHGVISHLAIVEFVDNAVLTIHEIELI